MSPKHLLPLICVLMSFLSGQTFGQVYLPETLVRTGYGPTQVQWSASWSGACAERVGVEVSYAGKDSLTDLTADVIEYAQGVVPHVVAHCPKAQVLHVSASGGKQTRPVKPQEFRFELSHARGWAMQNSHWYNQKMIREKIDAGYWPASAHAPMMRALIRFKAGTLEGIYGAKLKSHLSANEIKRHFFEDSLKEGNGPPRVWYHLVTGDWHELGNATPNGSCPTSRDGYALWGTFTLRVSPGSSDAQMIRKYCESNEAKDDAPAETKGHSDRIKLSDLSPSNRFATSDQEWNAKVRQLDFAKLLNEQLLAMEIESGESFADYAKTRQPLYQNSKLTIFSKQKDWCQDRSLEAYYKPPNQQRDQAFGGNYRKEILSRVQKIVKDYCGDALTANVANYSEGEDSPWDSMSFQFRAIRPHAFGWDGGFPKMIDYRPSKRALAHKEFLLANHFGAPCTDGMFCTLPAGNYLNAIYEGRGDLVAAIDKQYLQEMTGLVNEYTRKHSNDAGIIRNFFNRMATSRGLIVQAINKYMYDYQSRESTCFKSGARERTFRLELPTMATVNPDGSVEEGPLMVSEASYKVNPEFFAVLEKVGNSSGAPRSDRAKINTSYSLVLQGLVAIKNSYNCNSAEVAQFEQHLIAFAEQSLSNQPLTVLSSAHTAHNSIPPKSTPPKPIKSNTAVVRNQAPPCAPQPKASMAEPGAETKPTTGIPAKQKAKQRLSPQAAQGQPETKADSVANPLSEQERYAKRNAEIIELNKEYKIRIDAMNADLKKQIQNISSPQDQAKKLAEYQKRLGALNAEIQQKTQAITEKYK